MNAFDDIRKSIIKNKLKPATERDLPLLTASIIALGYTVHLKKIVGYSYESVAFIGKENYFYSMFNEERLNLETKRYLQLNKKKINLKLVLFMSDFEKIKKEINVAYLRKDKIEALRIMLSDYIQYMGTLGVYNCFWRYVGNKKSDKFLSEELITEISAQRETIAKFYPSVQKKIYLLIKDICKSLDLDNYLVQFMSYTEIIDFLKNKKISENKIKDIHKRKKGYFYLLDENTDKEIITSDEKIIHRIKKDFFQIDDKITTLKGFMVYKGAVKGSVFNLNESKQPTKEGYILVASSTHPKDIKIIEKSIGLVVDEGGILSHAAIIARELKKPCIIGTKIATRVLHEGDIVEVDANNGIVRKLK